MTTTERLVDQLRRSAEGDAWHGPSVREALEGVTVSDASAHPIPRAHSIRELVLHMAAGIQLVLRRLNGDGRQLTAEEDWPAPSEATDDAWQRDVASLFALNQRLREAVATFPKARLDEPLVPESAVFGVHSVHRAHAARPLPRGPDRPAAPGPRSRPLTSAR